MMNQQDGGNTKNMMMAMGLTMAVLVGWSFFFDRPDKEPVQDPAQAVVAAPAAASATTPSLPGSAPTVAAKPQEDLKTDKRLAISTPSLKGTIRLQGARLDDLTLIKYSEDLKTPEKKIKLLSADKAAHAYFADFGWLVANTSIPVPGSDTVWSVQGNETLTPETPVILTWENGQGLTFVRTLSVDKDYLFTIKDQVKNSSAKEVELYAFSMITRDALTEVSSFFILHEGPIGYLGNKLIEHKYDDLKEKAQSYTSTGGWGGLTDKYWLTALIMPQDQAVKTSYRHAMVGTTSRYYADAVSPALVVRAGEEVSYTSHFYAGAKVLDLLDGYEDQLKIPHFDLAVDFGWFYFLTKPIFHILNLTKDYLGNFGLGILLLTVLLKLLFFPLANKSYRSMARMKQLQPKMEKLKEQHQDDRMAMNTALMELYKKEKVNPMAGCLPMLVQIPVFFALYKVLFVSIEMRHAPFYGWIHDLSAADPTSLFNLFGLLPYDVPSFLHIGAWPLIMGATMLIQQRLNPAPTDPIQEKMFMLMPIIFTVMLASFPAGLVIYWAWNNLLTIAQQWTIMRLEAKRSGKK